jgi:uncharacterized protein
MKFYGRQIELGQLERLDRQASKSGRMTVLTGRRRVGKTVLALHHVRGKKFLYLFVSRKEEQLLCQEFLEELKKQFSVPVIGEIRSFRDFFAVLLEIAKNEKLTVIFDEFQEFLKINDSVYSDVQKLWDLNKDKIKMHVIFIGSIYSLMHKIFEDDKQPLFGRADRIFRLKAFPIKVLMAILKDNKILTAKNLFDFYVITGGMPKYVALLVQEGAKNLDFILDLIFEQDSLLINEDKNILIEEFGRDYLTYFTLLELIAHGKTGRGEIESLLQKEIGGYLHRLEKDYSVIKRFRSIDAKVNAKNQKYKIMDNFLNFWFRFIYHYRSAIEIGNFSYVKKIVKRDYSAYAGAMLERYFHQVLAETEQYNRIGSYWEKNNQNEIDIVAINDLEKKILVAEVKLNRKKISMTTTITRAARLMERYSGYTPEVIALSLEDVFSDRIFMQTKETRK